MQKFGNIWRHTINTLLSCKQHQSELAKQLEAEDKSALEIKCKCEAQIWGPAWNLKESLGTGQLVGTTNEEWVIIQLLWPVLCSYSTGYKFAKQSIYYDTKAFPLQHLKQRKETCVKKYQKILEHKKKADIVDITVLEHTLSAGSYIKPDLKLFEEYLAAQADVAERLTRFYNRTMCHQQIGAMTPEVPLYWKLQLSAYINRKRADQLLINCLRKRFSPDTVFVVGNWGAPMTRFHEPIRGKFWWTLKCGGFTVYLIDEHLTSSFCPICKERILTFLNVQNPRPFRRTSRPMRKTKAPKTPKTPKTRKTTAPTAPAPNLS
ncbi:hypothetical protein IWW56_001202 [Coemansia sp. RSA 2131]|nr:hypothetical protein IWW56_001202 [Coemansia sp. RSA 2131]